MANFADSFFRGAEYGAQAKQRREESAFSKMAGDYYGADPAGRDALRPQMAALNPERLFQLDSGFDQRDSQRQKRAQDLVTNTARLWSGVPAAAKPQAYAVMRQRLIETDPQMGQWLPEQYDEATVSGLVSQVLGGQNEVPSDIRTLRMLQADPTLLETNDRFRGTFSFDEVQNPDGSKSYVRRNNRDGTVGQAPVGGQQMPQAQPAYAGDPMQVLGGISALAQTPGVQTTSLHRDPQRNADVGGVANSQHMRGTAGDFVVPQATKPAFIAQARALGFEAIDEGDHIHVELPPGAGMGGGGQMPAQAAPSGFGQTDEQRARAEADAEAMKVRAAETARRQLGLEYADAEADAAARAAGGKKAAELAAERAANAPKTIARYQAALATAENVTMSIDNALRLAGPASTGFAGARLRGVEGTPAFNLAAEVQTIKANLGFDRLQQMRDNSPTGGALGQVAVQELVALQSTIANLDPDQSEPQLRANLQRVQKHYNKWRETVEKAIAEEQSLGGRQAGGGDASSLSDDELRRELGL
jgi:hypothetical protein